MKKFVRPRLEYLEDRCLLNGGGGGGPGMLAWHPIHAGNSWNDPANWWDTVNNVQATAAPTRNDIAVFSPTGGGSDSDCNLSSGGGQCLALRMSTGYTHTILISGVLEVGYQDSSASENPSYMENGKLDFVGTTAFLSIWSEKNSTGTGGFSFDGGVVDDATCTQTGTVTVKNGACTFFSFAQGNVSWGANLNVDPVGITLPAGEVHFPTGGNGDLVWSFSTSHITPNIDNQGNWFFDAADASDTISGIRGDGRGLTKFMNEGSVTFMNGPGKRMHEDLVFWNGTDQYTGNNKPGVCTIQGGDRAVFLGMAQSIGAYPNVTLYQNNPGSYFILRNGSYRPWGDSVFNKGYFWVRDDGTMLSQYTWIINEDTVVGNVYFVGSQVWLDVSQQRDVTLFTTGEKLFFGNSTDKARVEFDFMTPAGASSCVKSQIQCDQKVTVNNCYLELHVNDSTKPVFPIFPLGTTKWNIFVCASSVGWQYFDVQYTGSWTGWGFGWSNGSTFYQIST